jgi:hypothetical protein
VKKKAYLPPTLIAHGCAVARTQGRFGKVAELINYWFPPVT